MSDTVKLVMILAAAVYGIALIVAGIVSSYRAIRIRAIEQQLAELTDTVQSLQVHAEKEQPEPPNRIRSMWGNHG